MRRRASREGTAARLGRHSGREGWLTKSRDPERYFPPDFWTL